MTGERLPLRPDVRVVVVTYNSGAYLQACLDSLHGATDRAIEIVVVDNGSTDGAPEAVAGPGVTVLPSIGNLGYGGGANRGAKHDTGSVVAPWLLIINPDVVFAPSSLDALLTAAERWPRAGILGPAIHTDDGMIYPSARQLPSLSTGVGHGLLGWLWPRNPWTLAYRRENDEPVEGRTGWLSGSCLLTRREAFDAVGGFDEAYFMYFEDTDLCARIAHAGWDVVYIPSAVIGHAGGHSTNAYRSEMTKAHHVSAYRYFSRQYPGPRRAPLRLLICIGLELRRAAARVVPRVSAGAVPTRKVSQRP